MKKFDIKKLLILLLAIVLVFALVACNKGGGEDDNDGGDDTTTKKPAATYKAANFISDMFTTGSAIGKTAVDTTDPMTVALGLTLDVAVDNGATLAADIDLKLYIDQNATTPNYAAKISAALDFFDMDLYFFLSDPKNVYLESSLGADGTVYRVPIEMTNGEDNWNSAWAKSVYDFLVKDMDLKTGITDESIWGLVKAIAGTFGSTYTLDTTLNQILAIAGLDLGELLDGLKEDPTFGSILSGLNITKNDQGFYSLASILDAVNGVLTFANPTAIEDAAGNKGYELTITTNLVKTLLQGTVNGMLASTVASPLLGGALEGLLNPSPAIAIGFTSADGMMENFYLKLKLQPTGTAAYTVKIGIDKLEIKNTTATAYSEFGTTAAKCSTSAKVAEVVFGNTATGATTITVPANMFTVNYDMTSTSFISEILGKNAVETWGIPTSASTLYTVRNTADAFVLNGTYTLTGGKLVASLGDNGIVIGGKLAFPDNSYIQVKAGKAEATDTVNDFKVIVKGDANSTARMAYEYVVQLLGMALSNSKTDIAVKVADGESDEYAYNAKVVAAMQSLINYGTANAAGEYTIDVDDALWNAGIIDSEKAAVGDWDQFIINTIDSAIKGTTDENPQVFWVVNGAVIATTDLTASYNTANVTFAVPEAAKQAADARKAALNADDSAYGFYYYWDGYDEWTVGSGDSATTAYGHEKAVTNNIVIKAKFGSSRTDGTGVKFRVVPLLNQVATCLANVEGGGYTFTVANLNTFLSSFLGANYLAGTHPETDAFIGQLLAGSTADSVAELLAGSAKITLTPSVLKIEYTVNSKTLVIETGLKIA